jgi:twitching motility protein PilT
MDETRLGAILLDSRIIDEADLEKCLAVQTLTGNSRPLGNILVEQGVIDRGTLERVLQLQQTRSTRERAALPEAEGTDDVWFRVAVQAKASELVVSEGRPVLARVGAEWRTLTEEPLNGPEVWDFVRTEMGAEVLEELADRHYVVRDLHKPGVCRGRITGMRHFDGVAAVVELRREATRSWDELSVPRQLAELMRSGRGLVLLCGERGIGRTELMAGLLREAAAEPSRYLIVLDDAIDAELPAGGGLVVRRRVGEHVAECVQGLRTAVREDPDVIFVGSVAEPETFDMALRAAEGGRLVVCWLDASSVTAGLARILNFYRDHEVARVRSSLATVLRAVYVRHLLAAAGGDGTVPVTELLLVDEAVRDILRGTDLQNLQMLMRMGDGKNGHSLDQSMFEAVTAGLLDFEDAYARAGEKAWLLERTRNLPGQET